MNKHQSLKMNIRNSSSSVISEINAVWTGFMIPIIRPQHSIKKLKKFYRENIKLKNITAETKNRKLN